MDDWRSISAAMSREDAVFIVGVPRSGTTALRSTFEHHPSFRSRNPRSPETKVFVAPERIPDVLEPGGERLRRYLGDDAAAARLQEMARQARAAGAGSEHLVRLFFHHARAARGMRRVLEKTPRHLKHLHDIDRAFPRAKVMICIRHPVDCYSSYRKRLVLTEKRRGLDERHQWLGISRKRFAAKYNDWVERAQDRIRGAPERSRLVRYEELTAEPRRVLADLCAFIDEPFPAAEMLDDLAVERDGHGSPKPGRRLVPSEKRWRDYLTDKDARSLEKRVAASMQRLAYARYT